MLQHERKDLGLPGLTPDGFEIVFLVCEIKRVAHGFKQGKDIVVTLVLFYKCLVPE